MKRSLWISITVGGFILFGIFALWVLRGQIQHASQIQSQAKIPVLGQVADFALTNQNGQVVALADLRGKIWIADIIFTTCPGPCRQMTREMKDLQDSLPPGTEPKLISLTTFPDFDTPPVLKAYGEKYGADFNRWSFLTGTKAQIFDVANSSLKLSAMDKPPADRDSPYDLFIHSTYLVLVDRNARLRGVFQTVGEGVNFNDVKKEILNTVEALKHEP